MISAQNLYKWYGNKLVVDGISFSVSTGEVLGFIGPNGAGKSTTMRMITGFIPPSQGSASIGSHSMTDSPLEAKAMLGYLPENAPLYGGMTVREFLRFSAEIRGLRGQELKSRVDTVVELCFLEQVWNQNIDTLSKGYRHRTCFAQAIIHDPPALVLDEPTDGLDPNQKREIRKLIAEMGKSKAILLSTHILEEVEAVCTRVAIIHCGKKVFDGSPGTLKSRSASAGAVVLTVARRPVPEINTKLEALPGSPLVTLIEESETDATMKIFPKAPQSGFELSGEVFKLARDEAWQVTDFHIEDGRLDEIFHSMTQSGGPT
ncbi:MAG: ABC transporter ATP-binding protein [Lentisphaerae bacterium GWF2_52_8]|nr:MAG: ABC transporter ATP-binding protein [Lentisphaerae bacterium GWF2_52_8]